MVFDLVLRDGPNPVLEKPLKETALSTQAAAAGSSWR